MVPQNDPYTLENFQKAYDNLSLGKSIQTLTHVETGEFSGTEQLESTHYALKIFLRDEDERWKIELMEDIRVAYIPFNYVQLPEEEAEMIVLTGVGVPEYPETSHHSITYDDLETDEGAVDSETFNQYSSYGSSYNQDPIKSVPYAVISGIATTSSSNWATCRSLLQGYIGIYFTAAEFNQFVVPYDY